MNSEPSITHVKIGMYHVGKSPEIMKTTLGSCVGIAFLWRDKGICGLAHCLLPQSETQSFTLGAKYVDQAIDTLIRSMKITTDQISHIEVYVAGGGNMLETLSKPNTDHIGILNAKMALKLLEEKKFNILMKDLGGKGGRQMIVDCSDYSVHVKKIEDGSNK